MSELRYKLVKRQKTFFLKSEDVKIRWFLVDIAGKTIGRVATEIAKILRGKHSVLYTPNVACGDGVIVVNASKLDKNRYAGKLYYRYSGYQGGLKKITFGDMLKKTPDYIVKKAVKGMLGRGPLANLQLSRLKVFAGDEHGMEAQTPVEIDIA